MTKTDYLKARLDLLKILLSGVLGTTFVLSVYDIQTLGSNSFEVYLGIIGFIFLFFVLTAEYRKVMHELKELPKE
ncbi:MAG: hypothetical protein PHU34_02530 [Candidatus Methanoperedens sp.]|nr:hypothetical protein [Candidatus Methanoperedens sp.]